MHILLIHQAFTILQEPGGTRHYELARYLVDQGHRVSVITSSISYLTGEKTSSPSTSTANQHLDGLKIQRAFAYHALHRSFFHRILNFLSFMISSFQKGLMVQNVDLVWGTSPPIFQALTSWALAKIKRVPFLFEVRDLWPAFAVAVGVLRNPLLIQLGEWLEGFLYRHADTVLVNSPGFIEHVRHKGASRIELVTNGSDASMFDPSDSGTAFRRVHKLEGKYIVLYAGAHGMSNDLGVVLECANFLRNEPEIIFVLLGDGKDKPLLVERANRMELSNLIFLPPIPKTEMPQALAAADACLAILKPIPLYATVYPNKVFDYMASGKPVILAIEGVIKEVVESVSAGIAVPPGKPDELAKAVRNLAAQPDLGRIMGANGRAYVEKSFNRRELAARLEQILQNLVHS